MKYYKINSNLIEELIEVLYHHTSYSDRYHEVDNDDIISVLHNLEKEIKEQS